MPTPSEATVDVVRAPTEDAIAGIGEWLGPAGSREFGGAADALEAFGVTGGDPVTPDRLAAMAVVRPTSRMGPDKVPGITTVQCELTWAVPEYGDADPERRAELERAVRDSAQAGIDSVAQAEGEQRGVAAATSLHVVPGDDGMSRLRVRAVIFGARTTAGKIVSPVPGKHALESKVAREAAAARAAETAQSTLETSVALAAVDVERKAPEVEAPAVDEVAAEQVEPGAGERAAEPVVEEPVVEAPAAAQAEPEQSTAHHALARHQDVLARPHSAWIAKQATTLQAGLEQTDSGIVLLAKARLELNDPYAKLDSGELRPAQWISDRGNREGAARLEALEAECDARGIDRPTLDQSAPLVGFLGEARVAVLEERAASLAPDLAGTNMDWVNQTSRKFAAARDAALGQQARELTPSEWMRTHGENASRVMALKARATELQRQTEAPQRQVEPAQDQIEAGAEQVQGEGVGAGM